MCLKKVERFHKRSHIIPDWMYEFAFSDKHKLLVSTEGANSSRIIKKQSGSYSEIICGGCEGEFAKDDTHMSHLLKAHLKDKKVFERLKVTDPHNQRLVLIETWSKEIIEAYRVKRFVLGVLIRSHLYFLRKYGVSSLPDHHFHGVKEAYYSKDDFASYPITVYRFPFHYKEYCLLPIQKKVNKGVAKGHHIHSFLAFGYYFNTVVSNHRKSDQIMDMCLKGAADFKILGGNIDHYFPEIISIIEQFNRSAMKYKKAG